MSKLCNSSRWWWLSNNSRTTTPSQMRNSTKLMDSSRTALATPISGGFSGSAVWRVTSSWSRSTKISSATPSTSTDFNIKWPRKSSRPVWGWSFPPKPRMKKISMRKPSLNWIKRHLTCMDYCIPNTSWPQEGLLRFTKSTSGASLVPVLVLSATDKRCYLLDWVTLSAHLASKPFAPAAKKFTCLKFARSILMAPILEPASRTSFWSITH